MTATWDRPALVEPSTAQEAIRRLQERHDWLLATQQFEPYLYPRAQVGFAVVLIYLAIDHRRRPLLSRLAVPTWLYSTYSTLSVMLHTKARGAAPSLGVGIISAWFVLWAATIMVLSDCQESSSRIWTKRCGAALQSGRTATVTPGSTTIDGLGPDSQQGVRRRRVGSNGPPRSAAGESEDRSEVLEYFWQPYPATPLTTRIGWAVDVATCFRGMGWDWRSIGLPPLPERISSDLKSSISDPNTNTPGDRANFTAYPTRSSLLRRNALVFCRNYLVLDLVKTLAAHDPWFWGYTGTTTPPGYLPIFLQIATVINVSRVLICLAAMKFALELIFSLGPLFFVGVLGSFKTTADLFGVWTEPWMYPDHFGSLSVVARKGLAGWWGAWWHQTFRKGFQAPADALVAALDLDGRSTSARALYLAVAFGLSAFVHACGSMTQVGDSRPWRPALFFALQPLGIGAQMGVEAVLKRRGLSDRAPVLVGRTANFVFAHTWLYFTAPLLLEDFARGGTFLFEPVPFSPLRGVLRLGSVEDRCWLWHGDLIRWHTGRHWWESGIMF